MNSQTSIINYYIDMSKKKQENLQPNLRVINTEFQYFFFRVKSVASSKRTMPLLLKWFSGIFQVQIGIHFTILVSLNEPNIDFLYQARQIVGYIAEQCLRIHWSIIAGPSKNPVLPSIIVVFSARDPMFLIQIKTVILMGNILWISVIY